MPENEPAPGAPEEEPASSRHLALAAEAEEHLAKLMAEGGGTIAVLLPLIKATIGAVGKNRRMEEGRQKYLYRSVDDMLDAAHAGLVRAGVSPIPVDYAHVGTSKDGKPEWWPGLSYVDFTTAGGTKGVRIMGRITYRLTGPKDTQEVPILVEGNDYADKGTAKVYALGLKLLLAQLFTIPYGLPDQDDESPQRLVDQPAQRQGGGGQRSQGGRQSQRPSAPRSDGNLASEANVKAVLELGRAMSAEGRKKLKVQRTEAGAGGPLEVGKLDKDAWRKVMTIASKLVKEHPKSDDGEPEEEPAGAPEPEAPSQPAEPGIPEGVDTDYRDHLAGRLDALGEDWSAEVQSELDALQDNPLAEAPWMVQLAQLPPEWDDALAEVTAKLEGAHAESVPVPEGGEEF